jgi:hypothetical protein
LTISDGQDLDTETKIDYISVFTSDLEIGEITGGILKIDAEIQNNGDTDLENVDWEISIVGGLIDPFTPDANGTLNMLDSGETAIVTTKPVLGLCSVEITVTADGEGEQYATKTVEGFVFLFFVIIK